MCLCECHVSVSGQRALRKQKTSASISPVSRVPIQIQYGAPEERTLDVTRMHLR